MLSSYFSRLIFLLVCVTGLNACGGGGDSSEDTTPTTPTPTVETFNVTLSQESIAIEPGGSQTIDYTFEREGENNFDIEVTMASNPTTGAVTLDTGNNRLTYTSEAEGDGSFSLMFKSASLQINRQILYQVKAPVTTPTDPDPTPDPDTPVIKNDQDFIIYLPSDHITIYEDETITLDIRRNYEMHEQIIEEFYFNTDNIQGSVSDDKTQITLTAVDSESDTYGEITAVTNVNGILYESKMYVIYYNKNRDLTTTEPPVVALLEHEIQIAPYASTVKFFDIYDPDSDRISYRVLAAPKFAETHMMKVPGGYELTIHAIDEIDPNDNDVVLQVSDAHRADIHTFNLIEDKTVTNSKNRPPELSIEENVTVSLIREFNGTETGQIAELAFVHSDPDGDDITLSAKASVDGKYSFNIQPPYLYVSASDIKDLQYDQITLTASDGKFDTKMTFHFYVEDNFTQFLGGNPNTAPMTDLPTQLTLLEGKRYEIPYNSYDHEKHPFDVGIEQDSAFVTTTLTDSHLVLVAGRPEVTTQSSVTIWLEDVFESRREHTISFNIVKNTAPTLELDFVATDEKDDPPYSIAEPEQTPVEVKVTITDPDEEDLQPVFTFDSNFVTVDYDSATNIATVNSRDLNSDYQGQLVISATDEFGERVLQSIDLDYQFKDPNNQFPIITIAQEAFTVLPGGNGSTTVTIVDPESDPLVIDSHKSSDDLTYSYNIATGALTFEVSDQAAYEQELTITISASDGFGLSQKNIVVTIPKSPEAPKLTVDFYEQKVPEKEPFIVTFSATDANNEQITMETQIPNGTGLTVAINITEDNPGSVRGHLLITPTDNVLSEQNLNFILVARDASNEIDSESIPVSVQPVNDPPEVEFVVLDGVAPGDSGEIILSNKDFVTLSYGIKDPDTTGQEVRVIYDVKSGQYEVATDVFERFEYYIESFVTTSSNQIRVNGNSKKDVYGYVSFNKGSLAVNGDTYQDTIKVQVREPIGDGSNNSHGDEKDVNVTLKFVNNKPVVGSFDLIQLFEVQNQVINLSVTDGDIPDRNDLEDGDEEICITINNSSDHLRLYDLRPAIPTLLPLGRKHCDTDLAGPLTQIRIDTLAVTGNETEFFTINVTDGYENTSQIVQVEILNN